MCCMMLRYVQWLRPTIKSYMHYYIYNEGGKLNKYNTFKTLITFAKACTKYVLMYYWLMMVVVDCYYP